MRGERGQGELSGKREGKDEGGKGGKEGGKEMRDGKEQALLDKFFSAH